MVGWEWLRIGHIECRPYVVCIKGIHQGVGDNHRSTSCIYEQSTALHQRKLACADHVAGLVRQRNDCHDDIGLRQQPVQLTYSKDAGGFFGGSGEPDNLCAERCQSSFDCRSDGAVSHNKHRFVGEILTQNSVLTYLRTALIEKVVRYRGLSEPLAPRL